ncbi:hypothetical protein FOA43_002619 [Brettanomyces nanus]|uniref:Uncharacterized protein n=1 Tax=Eeniella nana TaxID=13502 RepID=A0A875S6B1_EENNA|nr:uncharacterized protein FOA43_002619 [Brettanomyces nanus]QPG75269.1 hypothetical protein FOA43_002619 [Brettanomyces nanus]
MAMNTTANNTVSPSTSNNSARYNLSNGATSIIRRRLHFIDEAAWKKFTTRRLQLVESLSLSSKKASEQDDQISLCALTLMSEFAFPEDTLPEFDKLVRLAIQSVRRNKKRSEKRLASKLQQEEQRRKKHKIDEHNEGSKFLATILYEENGDSKQLQRPTMPQPFIKRSPSFRYIGSGHSSPNGAVTSQLNSMTANSPVMQEESGISRLAITSLVAPVIQDQARLPSIRKLNLNPEFTDAAKKILNQIKRSKTCYEFSCVVGPHNTGVNKSYDLLDEVGSSCITSAVLFTLEKWFDHLILDSSSYIKLRLKSDMTLSVIIKNLDPNSVEVNRLSDYVASQLFKKLIGGCVKDFGFNSVLYPLCDIFRGVVLKDYPLVSKESKIQQWMLEQQNANAHSTTSAAMPPFTDLSTAASKSLFYSSSIPTLAPTPSPSAAPSSALAPASGLPFILNTPSRRISLPPLGNQLTSVIIKFNHQELKFFYSSQTNAPPTLLELVSNSKSAFGVIDHARILKIRNNGTGRIINNDFELEKLFRITRDRIDLELVFSTRHDYLNLNYEKEKPEDHMNGITSPTLSKLTPSISSKSTLMNFQRLL